MPRIPVHTLESAPAESHDALKALEERYGAVLNIFGGMAHAPALLGLYTAAEDTLAALSSLDQPTRRAVHLTVAQVNDCGYCQAAYIGGAKAAGFSVDETLQIRRGAVDADSKLTALLRFARELVERRGHVAEETWTAALEAGWSDRQLLEVLAEIVRTTLTNYFDHLAGTELDLPPAPELRRGLRALP
jgi:AhpD family alkylhydroperoxidase